jgi:hypothetical protein
MSGNMGGPQPWSIADMTCPLDGSDALLCEEA